MPANTKKKNNTKAEAQSSEKNSNSLSELRELLKENIALTKELEERVLKINRWVTWQRVYFWVKIVVIVIPVAFGIIYLPPLFAEYFQQFKHFLSGYGF